MTTTVIMPVENIDLRVRVTVGVRDDQVVFSDLDGIRNGARSRSAFLIRKAEGRVDGRWVEGNIVQEYKLNLETGKLELVVSLVQHWPHRSRRHKLPREWWSAIQTAAMKAERLAEERCPELAKFRDEMDQARKEECELDARYDRYGA